MKAPKNFYNNLDQKKVGIDDLFTRMAEVEENALPEVTEADNGKALIVENGAWNIGTVDALPEVTADDNGKILEVINGEWTKSDALNDINNQIDLIKILLGLDPDYEIIHSYDFKTAATDDIGDVDFTLASGAAITSAGLSLPSADSYGLTSNATAALYPTVNTRYVVKFGDITPALESANYIANILVFGNSFKLGYNPASRKWIVNDNIVVGDFAADFLKNKTVFITFGSGTIRFETINTVIYEGACTTNVNQALMFGYGRIGFIKAIIENLKVYSK